MGNLTDTKIKNSKPQDKAYSLTDGEGLMIIIQPTGKKVWRFRYKGKLEKRPWLSLGLYPQTSLKKAREQAAEYRKLALEGIHPSRHTKQSTKLLTKTFEDIAREWWSYEKDAWTTNHARKIIRRLETHIFPDFGHLPIQQVTLQLIVANLKKSELVGTLETAKRQKEYLTRIFNFAMINGDTAFNPCSSLGRGFLKSSKVKHQPAITDPKELKKLLLEIDNYNGSLVCKCALKLSPLLFVRPNELRKMEWSEIDFENGEWRIPPDKMKMRNSHIVPLSRQSIIILKNVQLYSNKWKYVFPAMGSRPGKDRPMSENAVNDALKRLGYKGKQTAHGFRSTASTILNGKGYLSDWIEMQLAHVDLNSSRRAYNHASYLPERKKMMQDWADYLDQLKETAS